MKKDEPQSVWEIDKLPMQIIATASYHKRYYTAENYQMWVHIFSAASEMYFQFIIYVFPIKVAYFSQNWARH